MNSLIKLVITSDESDTGAAAREPQKDVKSAHILSVSTFPEAFGVAIGRIGRSEQLFGSCTPNRD